jgi:hypothetical protein
MTSTISYSGQPTFPRNTLLLDDLSAIAKLKALAAVHHSGHYLADINLDTVGKDD